MIDEKSKKLSILFIIICFLQIFYIFHYRSGFLKEVFINSFDENVANKYAVTKEVIEIKNLINHKFKKIFGSNKKLKISKFDFFPISFSFNVNFFKKNVLVEVTPYDLTKARIIFRF